MGEPGHCARLFYFAGDCTTISKLGKPDSKTRLVISNGDRA
jgi:hypothetical protein